MFGTWDPDEDDTLPLRRAAARPAPESLAPLTCEPPASRRSAPTFIIPRTSARRTSRLVGVIAVAMLLAPSVLAGAIVADFAARRRSVAASPPAPTTGTIVGPPDAPLRVDGERAASRAVVRCGRHRVAVGEMRKSGFVDVPCGGEVRVR